MLLDHIFYRSPYIHINLSENESVSGKYNAHYAAQLTPQGCLLSRVSQPSRHPQCHAQSLQTSVET